MHRPQIYDQAQGRDYDVLMGWREALYALGQLAQDMPGSNATIVTGLAASQTCLVIDLAAGNLNHRSTTVGHDGTQWELN